MNSWCGIRLRESAICALLAYLMLPKTLWGKHNYLHSCFADKKKKIGAWLSNLIKLSSEVRELVKNEAIWFQSLHSQRVHTSQYLWAHYNLAPCSGESGCICRWLRQLPSTRSLFFGGRRAYELIIIINRLLYKELYGLYKNAGAVFYFQEVSMEMHKTKHDLKPICLVFDVPSVWDFGHVTVVSF